MSQSNIKDLALATEAIYAARAKFDTMTAEFRLVEGIDGREWKSRADRELESIILMVLQDGSDYSILSEESGRLGGENDLQWIVDPLDGTTNFCLDVPFYCVSVGLWRNKSPLLGAVLEIPSNRLFTGIVGVGAWCNEIPIKVNAERPVDYSKAVFCTGLPVAFEYSKDSIQKLVAACQHFGKVRMLGSAALMLCYVASGRSDSYWESRIAVWDIGAGLAIVQAAGGATRVGEIDCHLRVDVEAARCDRLLASEAYGK